MKSMHCEVDFLQESVYWARKKRPLSSLMSVCIKHVNFRENLQDFRRTKKTVRNNEVSVKLGLTVCFSFCFIQSGNRDSLSA